ncbi:phosphatidate cytidylyltransferase [Sphingomonas sp. FW199]|uniref:phosphatidate cytidylyltransferase n=1 Tax=Sphingomonas sp. FW199 TaxID=3400217 RepID=UPI003CF8D7FA
MAAPLADLSVRAGVGLALAVVGMAVIWLGGFAFWLALTVVGLLMLREWGGLTETPPRAVWVGQMAMMVPLAILSPWAAGPGFLGLGLILGAAVFAMAVDRRLWLSGGILYVGLPILALLILRDRPDGILLTLWAMALVWACDIGAYFAGRFIGGPRLAPMVSPNKTWAGLGGGVLAAGLFALVLSRYGLPPVLAMATPMLAVLAQIGDLFESWLKRRAGVKDASNLLPGHGGLMDRLDGLVPVAPCAALLLALVPGIG